MGGKEDGGREGSLHEIPDVGLHLPCWIADGCGVVQIHTLIEQGEHLG